MNSFHRLHALRMENDAKRFAMDEMRPRFDTLRDRHSNGTAPKVVTAYQLFQTPDDLAQKMVTLADITPQCTVLEPSAGLGRLLRPILARNPAAVSAVEISGECAAVLYEQFPQVRLFQGDFLERNFDCVDRVVMNPPFHMRADIRHVQHAMQFLNPGGVLVGLCLAGHMREATLRPLSDHWEQVDGAFKAEGTQISCFLFRIKCAAEIAGKSIPTEFLPARNGAEGVIPLPCCPHS